MNNEVNHSDFPEQGEIETGCTTNDAGYAETAKKNFCDSLLESVLKGFEKGAIIGGCAIGFLGVIVGGLIGGIVGGLVGGIVGVVYSLVGKRLEKPETLAKNINLETC